MSHKRANSIYEGILQIVIKEIGDDITYGNQLQKISDEMIGNKFVGVFPSDMIPRLKNGQMAILNLDKSFEAGSHWVAISKYGKYTLVYDSFGRSSKKILQSIFTSGNGIVFDSDYDAEQIDTENSCGARSVAWLILLKYWGPKVALLI